MKGEGKGRELFLNTYPASTVLVNSECCLITFLSALCSSHTHMPLLCPSFCRRQQGPQAPRGHMPLPKVTARSGGTGLGTQGQLLSTSMALSWHLERQSRQERKWTESFMAPGVFGGNK